MPTYSYSPENTTGETVDRMRLELGDTTFAPGELTAALCDEEYKAIIGCNSSWKRAKIACLKSIIAKYAHQVNTSVDGVSYSLSDRVDFWKKELESLKAETIGAVPTVNMSSMVEAAGGHYFHKNMQANIRKDV